MQTDLTADDRPSILLSVNNSWNILNFRMGIVRQLQKDGFRVLVASPADKHAGELAKVGIVHLPIEMNSKGTSLLGDAGLLFRYWRLLRRYRPAAFLGWTIKPNIYGSIAARTLGIPALNNVSGLGTAFIQTGPLTAIVMRLYRLAFARSATVFFQNPEDRQLFVDRGLVNPRRTVLLPGSGIDTASFAPSVGERPRDGVFVFLVVARLLRDKGIVEFAEAARTVRRTRPNTRFELLGRIDTQNRTAIARSVLDGWIEEGVVTYLGDTADVRPHIAAADCIVLPSYREGMPRALLEGAAMAKPLIASKVPGCVEIVREGENGLFCRVRDAASLADAMQRMIDLTPEARAAMGATGRRIATDEFDERIVIDRYMTALNAALN